MLRRVEGNYIDNSIIQESVADGIATSMTKRDKIEHSDTVKCRILVRGDEPEENPFRQKEGDPPAPEDAPPPKPVREKGKGKGGPRGHWRWEPEPKWNGSGRPRSQYTERDWQPTRKVTYRESAQKERWPNSWPDEKWKKWEKPKWEKEWDSKNASNSKWEARSKWESKADSKWEAKPKWESKQGSKWDPKQDWEKRNTQWSKGDSRPNTKWTSWEKEDQDWRKTSSLARPINICMQCILYYILYL